MMAEFIAGPILVSAYDLHYKLLAQPFEFPSLIFLDSGGYEASQDRDLSETSTNNSDPRLWTREMHRDVLRSWTPSQPTAVIAYDHPKERVSVREQIERALGLELPGGVIAREILLKPESPAEQYLRFDSVFGEIHRLAPFDVVGVTEKEAGNSILQRMQNIARLRLALDKVGLEHPIHVFGSLDTITTQMYFLAGADIFDGLTWLRYAFHDGYTIYKQNYSAVSLGISARVDTIDGQCCVRNYSQLQDMELSMRRFVRTGDYGCFQPHGDLFKRACESLPSEVPS
jgi:hypothetical protein